MALTYKQRRFVAAYSGNATQAAREAGYSGSDETLATAGTRLLRNDEIRSALTKRETTASKGPIATRAERQAFWTKVVDDPAVKMTDRLKASELLGKSEADFVDRLEHSGNVRIAVVDPYAVKP